MAMREVSGGRRPTSELRPGLPTLLWGNLIAFYCDHFVLPLPEGHRFPMSKYSRLRLRLLEEGVLGPDDLREPDAATDDQLRLVHTDDWVRRVTAGELTAAEQRRIGFPWSPQMVERSRRSVGGTIAACVQALADGVAVNLAGGTHHAFADRGAGFCVFNDAAVAARVAQRDHGVTRIAIVDCDVHQGDGTAHVFRDDPEVFTVSLHGAGNYPFEKPPSDLDVGLEDGCGDADYLEALKGALDATHEAFDARLVIYLAGADPYEGDRFGRLGLTRGGLEARDRLVLEDCRRRGIPVAVVMSGGYARDIDDIVSIHAATVRAAANLYAGATGMSDRHIDAENERWEVRLGEHPAHPNVGTIIFYPRDNQRPYRVVEVPDDRFASQDELDRLEDDELKALFARADIMDYVHEDDAGAHHDTERARPLPPDVDAPQTGTRE